MSFFVFFLGGALCVRACGDGGGWVVGYVHDPYAPINQPQQPTPKHQVGVDQVTYGSLIHAFAKVGQWEAALRFLSEMRSPASGVRPNNFVYCSAMSACNRGNEWAIALDLLTQVGVGVGVCGWLMFWFVVVGDLYTCIHVCMHVCTHAPPPNPPTYPPNQQMMDEDGLAPDQYTINEALNACSRGALAERALEILDMARAAGVQPDVISYNKALQACISTRRWAEAQELMRRMAAERVAPDRTTHSLVEEVFLHGPPSSPAGGAEDDGDGDDDSGGGFGMDASGGGGGAAPSTATTATLRTPPSSSSSSAPRQLRGEGGDGGGASASSSVSASAAAAAAAAATAAR